MLGASMAGILNADARSDEEAKTRVVRTFGSILFLFFVFDIGCALSVLYMQCQHDEAGNPEVPQIRGQWYMSRDLKNPELTEGSSNFPALSICVQRSILHGFSFDPMNRSGSASNTLALGDLFVLAVLRCIMTVILLLVGVRFASNPKPQGGRASENNEENSIEASGAEVEAEVQAQDPLTERLLPEGETEVAAVSGELQASNDAHGTIPRTCFPCTPCRTRNYRISPALAKNMVQMVLFSTSTFYQVYAGLKVATIDFDASSSSSSSWGYNETIIPLLCLTVFWINVQSYVFGTLLTELTREDGLYLPPEVHRHPMYIETGRAISLNWCDLCRQRIQPSQGEEATCYRCALCDFDVCLKCANRQDAATVGENVLRGDRGVRAEIALTTTGYFQRSLQVAKQELPLLGISFILLAASSVSRLLLPHFQGHIIDKVIPTGDDGHYDKAGFLHFIRIYIFLMLVQGAISTLYSAIFTLVSRRLKFTIRNTLLEKILAQDVAYFDGTESGRLLSRLTNDLDLMMSPIQSSLSSLLSNVLILVGGMIMCFVKSYRLSMLAFVTVGPISYLWEQYAKWSKGLAREMISFWAEGNSIAAQALAHVRTVKAFGCEDHVLRKYEEANRLALNCGVKDAWGNGVTSALTGYLDLGAGVLILYFGGLLVYKGELTVGELVTFQLFWNMMNGAYENLQGLITSFTRSAAGAEKIFSLWDSDPDIDPKKGQDIAWQIKGHIQLHDVGFHYQMRPDNKVLNGFNLDIPAGKTIALVGRSGGGKSTIINLLLRFYDPKEGNITLDGKDYESLKVHQLRRLFGVVTQETELFALSVEENIAYGMSKEDYTMEDVISAAKKAFAHDFIMEMKDGYQTRIGERGHRLSGGQRQRLAIARVFLRQPKIILLDEATSALDENSQEAVQEALGKLITESNATVVLVAHRLSTVVNADSICVIDKGTVLEQGNHDELVAKGGIYASMVGKQLKKKADMIEQEDGRNDKRLNDSQKRMAADDINALLQEA